MVHEAPLSSHSTLSGEGKSCVRSVIGTYHLYWFYEFGTSRLAVRDQPRPSKPFIPGKFIILYLSLRISYKMINIAANEVGLIKEKTPVNQEILCGRTGTRTRDLRCVKAAL